MKVYANRFVMQMTPQPRTPISYLSRTIPPPPFITVKKYPDPAQSCNAKRFETPLTHNLVSTPFHLITLVGSAHSRAALAFENLYTSSSETPRRSRVSLLVGGGGGIDGVGGVLVLVCHASLHTL